MRVRNHNGTRQIQFEASEAACLTKSVILLRALSEELANGPDAVESNDVDEFAGKLHELLIEYAPPKRKAKPVPATK
jgi:hypothetical protein